MKGFDSMAALHMRLRWGYALHVQQQEPEMASIILTELLVQAYRDGAQAQKNGLHAPPLMIADNPDLAREWTYGHDDALRGALSSVCDCAHDSCMHRQRKPTSPFALEGKLI